MSGLFLLQSTNIVYSDCLNSLGTIYKEQGDLSTALNLYEEAVTTFKINQGTHYPQFVNMLNNLAVVYRMLQEHETAHRLLKQALAITRQIEGHKGKLMALCLNNMAILLYYEGNQQRAIKLMKQSVALTEKNWGSDHPNALLARSSLTKLKSNKW